MVTEYAGNIIPSPGVYDGNKAVGTEILFSTAAFTQKGVTLKAGQGVLKAGTILARDTASKKYVKYNPAGSGGANVARGVLRESVNTGTDANGREFQGNIVIRGILKYAVISAANATSGALAGAITGLGARTDDVIGTFTF